MAVEAVYVKYLYFSSNSGDMVTVARPPLPLPSTVSSSAIISARSLSSCYHPAAASDTTGTDADADTGCNNNIYLSIIISQAHSGGCFRLCTTLHYTCICVCECAAVTASLSGRQSETTDCTIRTIRLSDNISGTDTHNRNNRHGMFDIVL